MENSDANRPMVTADPLSTIFAAIELSGKGWLVAIQTPSRATISRHKLAAGDVGALLSLLDRIRQREAREGTTCQIITCYEAGYDGFWLHRALEAAGIRNHVLDPSSLQVDRRGRRAKTDRIDVETMLRALLAYCKGEPRVCRMVRVPTVEEEDVRRTHRERKRLISERIRHVNRIKGLLATQGIYDVNPIRMNRDQDLAKLRTQAGEPLPKRLMAELGRELDRLTLVLEHIAAVESERDAAVTAPHAEARWQQKLHQLIRLKSIGPEIGTVLSAEVFYRDFRNRREVGAYVGLTPCPFKSGRVDRDQEISKAGNKLARVTMIELAWIWLRYQPNSDLSIWFHERVGTAKGRVRRIAIVALARKLLVALWRYLEFGVVPNGAVLKA